MVVGIDHGRERSYSCRSDGRAQELSVGTAEQALVRSKYEAVVLESLKDHADVP